MEWIKYLLEANLYLAFFYLAYYVLMRRETYYQLNRAYLLSSSAFAFIIPLLQIGVLKPMPVQIIKADMVAPYTRQIPTPAAPAHLNYYLLIYVIVAAALAIGFGIRIFQLIRLSKRGKHKVIKNLKIIEIEENDWAFSFFSYLFIGKNLTTSDTVIRHEMVHIEQRHSMDIIYLELLKIVCWFNPFVYLVQHSIKELHEFIADSHVSAGGQDVDAYTDFLISNAYGMTETSLTNNFFNKNLLKNRIMMLHQKKSSSLARLKYLVALPLLVGMLCLSTLGFTKDYPVIDLVPTFQKTIAEPVIYNQQTPPKPKVDQRPIPPKPKVDQRLTPPKPKIDPIPVAARPKVKVIKTPPPPAKASDRSGAAIAAPVNNTPVYANVAPENQDNSPEVVNVPIAPANDHGGLLGITVTKQPKAVNETAPDSIKVEGINISTGESTSATVAQKKVVSVTYIKRTTPKIQVTTIPLRR